MGDAPTKRLSPKKTFVWLVLVPSAMVVGLLYVFFWVLQSDVLPFAGAGAVCGGALCYFLQHLGKNKSKTEVGKWATWGPVAGVGIAGAIGGSRSEVAEAIMLGFTAGYLMIFALVVLQDLLTKPPPFGWPSRSVPKKASPDR